MNSSLSKVAIGLALLALGLGIGYFYCYPIVLSVQNHVPDVRYSAKAFGIAPMCAILGLYYVLFRPSGSGGWSDLNPKEKPIFIIAVGCAVAAAFGFFYWFKQLLQINGYS